MKAGPDRERDDSAASAVALPGDYHVHTVWSDGTGTVEECVLAAVAAGLPEIGIADHISPTPGPDEDWWVQPARMAAYCEDVLAVAARHPEITVLLGLEAEYEPGHEAELDRLLDAWPFQFVVLGVHAVDGFVFDDPALRADPRWDDPDALLAAYYRDMQAAADYGRFDILAHFDYIGLWGHRPGPSGPARDRRRARRAGRVRRRYRAEQRPHQRSGRGHVSVGGHPARGARARHPADHRLRRARGRARRAALGRGHRARARAAGYRETLRLSDRALVPLPG